MLLKWFDTKEAILVGIKLADDLSEELAKVNRKHPKNDVTSRAKIIQNTFRQLDRFDGIARLNFYKKSKLINEFRWRLEEKGHDKDFVDIMARELLIYIN